MKKFLTLLMMLFCLCTAQAQEDVTTFLGIPVDGSKSDMEKKLLNKGFTRVKGVDCLEGQFNGTYANVFICTNNNKVCRIMVADKTNQDERDIKIRFNNLVRQFENNKRYFSFGKNIISEDEDISYEIRIHNKNYEAVFYQMIDTTKTDFKNMKKEFYETALSKYSYEQIRNPSKEIENDLDNISTALQVELLSKKPVWVRINRIDYEDKYYIAIYYDNEYNRANGEDL